jgi:hypothetical protein
VTIAFDEQIQFIRIRRGHCRLPVKGFIGLVFSVQGEVAESQIEVGLSIFWIGVNHPSQRVKGLLRVASVKTIDAKAQVSLQVVRLEHYQSLQQREGFLELTPQIVQSDQLKKRLGISGVGGCCGFGRHGLSRQICMGVRFR